MHAEIRTVRDPETRVRVVEERSNFDQNPEDCLKENADKLDALKKQITDAQDRLPNVELDYEFRVKISLFDVSRRLSFVMIRTIHKYNRS